MYMTYIVTTCMNVFDFSISMRGSRGGQAPPPLANSNSLNPIVKLPEKNLGPPPLPLDKQNYIHVCIHIPHTPQPSKFFLDPRMISAT